MSSPISHARAGNCLTREESASRTILRSGHNTARFSTSALTVHRPARLSMPRVHQIHKGHRDSTFVDTPPAHAMPPIHLVRKNIGELRRPVTQKPVPWSSDQTESCIAGCEQVVLHHSLPFFTPN